MAMASFPDEDNTTIATLIESLLLSFTACKEDADLCYKLFKFSMRKLKEHRPLHVSKNQILPVFENIALRFNNEGYPDFGEHLMGAVKEYVEVEVPNCRSVNDITWPSLHLLRLLSQNPFRTDYLHNLEAKLQNLEVLKPDKIEEFDWASYLKEGYEKFLLPTDVFNDSENEEESVSTIFEIEESSTLVNRELKIISNRTLNSEDLSIKSRDNEKDRLVEIYSNAAESGLWLMSHVQNSWWTNPKIGNHPLWKEISCILNHNNDESLCNTNRSIINKLETGVQYLNQYKVIREILSSILLSSSESLSRIEYLKSSVSIPSLSQKLFKSLIKQEILDATDKYRKMSSFWTSLTTNKSAPYSIVAYGFALEEACKPFLNAIISIERSVMKQDELNTVLSVGNFLKSYVEMIHFLYNIHNTAIGINWPSEKSWLSVSRLLSVLYEKIGQLSSVDEINIIIRLFLKTFSVYLKIVDHLMYEGYLQDTKEEFIIARIYNSGQITTYDSVSFESALKEIGIEPAAILVDVVEKLQNFCKNAEFLQKVGQLSELKQNVQQGSLYECFVEKISRNLNQYNNDFREEFSQNSDNFIVYDKEHESITQQIVSSNSSRLDDIIITTDRFGCNLIPVQLIMSRIFYDLIKSREFVAKTVFKNIMIQEYRLFDHFHNLTEFLLMDLYYFSSRIRFMEEDFEIGKSYMLQSFLMECVETNELCSDLFRVQILRNIERFSIIDINKTIDTIQLDYNISWPNNTIITKDILRQYYTPIFQEILKLKIAFSVISYLNFRGLPKNANKNKIIVRRLQALRNWVLQLLNTIRTYFISVVECHLSKNLTERNVKTCNINTLKKGYLEQLEYIEKECFLRPKVNKHYKQAMNRLWNVCDDVYGLWKKYSQSKLMEKEVNHAMELYVQCLWYIIKIVENCIKQRQNFNNNSYTKLMIDLKYILKGLNVPENLSFLLEKPSM